MVGAYAYMQWLFGGSRPSCEAVEQLGMHKCPCHMTRLQVAGLRGPSALRGGGYPGDMEETPTRCRCGRRILVTYGRTDCVYCLKDAAACGCDDLTLDADGFGEVAFFPAGKYKLEGRPGGWALLTRDDGGAFT